MNTNHFKRNHYDKYQSKKYHCSISYVEYDNIEFLFHCLEYVDIEYIFHRWEYMDTEYLFHLGNMKIPNIYLNEYVDIEYRCSSLVTNVLGEKK